MGGSFLSHMGVLAVIVLMDAVGRPSAVTPTSELPGCGSPVVTTRIVGGTDAVDGEWPWQVSVHYLGSHMCGGSLISSHWVLSAAHCFENSALAKDYKVYLGLYRLSLKTSPHTVISGVQTLIVNAEYEGVGSRGDIALLRLSGPINFTQYIMPICLPAASVTFPSGMECWVTGWGQTSYYGGPPPNGTLQKVMTPIIDHETCDKMYHMWTSETITSIIVQEDKICSGYIEGQKDSCQGDSGGPLLCKVHGVWYQAGVVSWGEGCANPYRPGVYTLIPVYEQWIRTFVDMNFHEVTDIPEPTDPCVDGWDSSRTSAWAEFKVTVQETMTRREDSKISKASHSSTKERMMRLLLILWLSDLPAFVFPELPAPPACGSPAYSERIIGGMDAAEGAWPWQVSVLYNRNPICGGSLISDQWVLSAAHCFDSSPSPSLYTVYLGAYMLDIPNSNAVESRVDSLIIHPQFRGPGSSGDIALVHLSRRVTYTRYILPVCLPSASMIFSPGMSCYVTGWGRKQSNEFLAAPKTLQQLVLPLISRQSCDQMYHVGSSTSANVPIIQNDQICAGYQAGQRDSCMGDSGGPLVCKMNGYWYQVGIVSWGDDCALPNRPGVYTSVPNYESWINFYRSQRFSSSSSPGPGASVLLLVVSLILHS
ncbi:transmembrane protease serine 9-like [Rhinoderma darwinii]|uniref:transmembrane protease serine 9-like n=1 Tax=Rhinoderma darwinii TaxID=43563 RepID=UPI003F67D903